MPELKTKDERNSGRYSLSLSLCGAFDRVARIMQLEREVAFVVRAKVKHVAHKRGDRIGKKGR